MPVATTAFISRAPSRWVRKAVVVGPAADRLDRLVGLDPPAAAVVRVLQADQPGADEVGVVGADQAVELLGLQHAAVALRRRGRPRR